VIRAVLDTNVFISALLKPNGVCGLILQAWRLEEFALLYSEELILELKDVVLYPRLKARLSRNEIGALIRQLRLHGVPVLNNRNSQNSPDPKDDFLIAIVQHGVASHLVSRDVEGILALRLEAVGIVTPELFMELLKTK
jgi:uncharacterized protein